MYVRNGAKASKWLRQLRMDEMDKICLANEDLNRKNQNWMAAAKDYASRASKKRSEMVNTQKGSTKYQGRRSWGSFQVVKLGPLATMIQGNIDGSWKSRREIRGNKDFQ